MSQRKIGLLVINGPLPPPYGGIATYLAHTLPFLATHGFDVHTIVDRPPMDPRQYDEFRRAGVSIYYGETRHSRKIAEIIKRIPLWISTMVGSRMGPATMARAAKSIAGWIAISEEVVKTRRIDIIHAYDYPWAQGFAAAHLAKRYNKKFVQTIFGEVVPHISELVHHDERGNRFKRLVRRILEQSNLILSVSHHCAREISHVGLEPERVKVTYYGIDVQRFRPDVDTSAIRLQYSLDGKRVVLFLGQVRSRKGPQVLLDAAPLILRRIPNAVFLVVGPDCGIAADLLARAYELNLGSKFLMLGPKPDEMLPAFFAASDVFVFPSCTAIECLGLTSIQAMACGKPVVGSNINGVPEVVIDGTTGFLVEPCNPEALAEKVSLLLEDDDLRRRMGAAGRQRAVEHFDRDRLAHELLDLYNDLLRVRATT
ncbi:MAG: glycosyltransferase family 4 protein [Ignavibacteria bacterium]|nr:glycosyltransferase family 4 protein [Ignavibacteria bacterium]